MNKLIDSWIRWFKRSLHRLDKGELFYTSPSFGKEELRSNRRSCRRLSQYFFLLLTIAIVSACAGNLTNQNQLSNSSTASPDCRLVSHVMGETCIPREPKRIVTVNIVTLSNALALGIQPIGSTIPTTFSEAPDLYLKDKVQEIEIIPTSGGEINLERILLLEPDLIVGPSHSNTRSVYPRLSQIAPTVLFPFEEISYQWKPSFFKIADLFDKTDVAERLMNNYYRRIEDLREKIDNNFCPTSLEQDSTKDCHQQLRVLYISKVDSDSFAVPDKDSFPRMILDDIGFQTDNLSSTSFSIEYLPQLESDILFIGAIQTDEYGLSDLRELEQVQEMPLWNQLKVVQKNRAYVVNRAAWWGGNILAAHSVINDLYKYLVNDQEQENSTES